ncbi:hypothetical protein S40285_09850 [Stachybotrys chlorohalonatus IBT 40285]|uniref:Uncharacterized protein n=1 Tax=Stachybotrys chlorohalonatus (strain IBT 40285) TaxID=1283841 RepID=A0A084R2V4_STAC4|nr:hypothetical protein S40285_09850 [Stachybotrys chlorohalonata IBT 40285]
MASNAVQCSPDHLGVRISLSRTRRIIITFPSTAAAVRYLHIIQKTKAHNIIELKSEQLPGDSRSVSLRLPSTVIEIEASTTYGGFLMTFDDENDARMWQKDLLLWRFSDRSKNQVYTATKYTRE